MRSAVATTRPPLRFGAGLSRHFVTMDPLMPSDWWAFAFTAALAECALVSANVSSNGMVGYLAATGLLVALFPSVMVRSTGRNWLLWAYPLWLVLSIAWSTAPERTAHSVALVIPTIFAGITLGGIPKRREVNLGGAVALFGFIAFSLVKGGHTAFYDTGNGGDALTGLGTGKNYFGHLAALSAIMAFTFFSFVGTRFGRLFVFLGLLDLAISIFALVGSHATGSLLSFLFACAVISIVFFFTRISWQLRVLSLALLAGIAILYMTFGQVLQQMLTDMLMQKFNKDATLTGRTILWDYADRLMYDHRMLGYGFNAFWFTNNPDAWTIWRMMGVAPMSGFNLHNTPREIMIEAGVVGFGIYIVSFGTLFVRTFFTELLRGDLTAGVRLGFICYFIVRMPVESTGFAAATVDATLLLAFLCATVKEPVRARRAETAPEPHREVSPAW